MEKPRPSLQQGKEEKKDEKDADSYCSPEEGKTHLSFKGGETFPKEGA